MGYVVFVIFYNWKFVFSIFQIQNGKTTHLRNEEGKEMENSNCEV